MGYIWYNCLSINSLCDGKNDVWTTKKYSKNYEDSHVRIEAEHIIESCNGRTRNETKNVSIQNKDDYYKPTDFLGTRNNLYLDN